jgi:transposase
MSVLSAMRFNPVIHRFANRLSAKGKLHKVVSTACIRKLLTILNTMIRNKTLWQPEEILKNP